MNKSRFKPFGFVAQKKLGGRFFLEYDLDPKSPKKDIPSFFFFRQI
jgi:hypothetical protein